MIADVKLIDQTMEQYEMNHEEQVAFLKIFVASTGNESVDNVGQYMLGLHLPPERCRTLLDAADEISPFLRGSFKDLPS